MGTDVVVGPSHYSGLAGAAAVLEDELRQAEVPEAVDIDGGLEGADAAPVVLAVDAPLLHRGRVPHCVHQAVGAINPVAFLARSWCDEERFEAVAGQRASRTFGWEDAGPHRASRATPFRSRPRGPHKSHAKVSEAGAQSKALSRPFQFLEHLNMPIYFYLNLLPARQF